MKLIECIRFIIAMGWILVIIAFTGFLMILSNACSIQVPPVPPVQIEFEEEVSEDYLRHEESKKSKGSDDHLVLVSKTDPPKVSSPDVSLYDDYEEALLECMLNTVKKLITCKIDVLAQFKLRYCPDESGAPPDEHDAELCRKVSARHEKLVQKKKLILCFMKKYNSQEKESCEFPRD